MIIFQNIDESVLKENHKNSELLKININSDLVVSGIEKSLEILKNEDNSKNSMLIPKIILHLDYDDIDILMHYLGLLHNYQNLYKNINFIFLFNESLAFKLEKGMNVIYFSDLLFTKKGIGLLPINNKSSISTKGLKWDISIIRFLNLACWDTEFGKKVSTSNEFLENNSSIYLHEGEIIFVAEIDYNTINII